MFSELFCYLNRVLQCCNWVPFLFPTNIRSDLNSNSIFHYHRAYWNMGTSPKHVVFDIVGTCVSYDALFDAIDHQLGDKLRAEGVKPKLLGYLWIEVTEREYT